MLLFNRNKTNKGKKYIKKSSVDAVFAIEAENFNEWFSANCEKIKNYLTTRKSLDSDSFTECYLKMYENILFKGTEIKDYRSYFVRAYYTLLMVNKAGQNILCELQSYHDKETTDPDVFNETENAHKELEEKIMNYVYKNYPIQHFEIFKMYVNLKPNISYKKLSTIIKLKEGTIKNIVSNIRKDISNNKSFTSKRKEITG